MIKLWLKPAHKPWSLGSQKSQRFRIDTKCHISPQNETALIFAIVVPTRTIVVINLIGFPYGVVTFSMRQYGVFDGAIRRCRYKTSFVWIGTVSIKQNNVNRYPCTSLFITFCFMPSKCRFNVLQNGLL